MATSIWNQIISKMVSRFESIQTAAGYVTNAGRYVGYYRSEPMQPDLLPGINIEDGNEMPVGESPFGLQMNERTVNVLCVGIGKTAAEAKEMSENVKNDVLVAIGKTPDAYPGETWGGLAIYTNQGDITITPRSEDEYFISEIMLSLTVGYRYQRWNPYAT